MRSTHAFVAAAAAAAVGVSAQSDITTYYKTEYYTDCSNVTSGLATETGTVVETHCPHCTEGGSPGASPAASGPLTTYTTIFKEFCSTAPDFFQEKTYTVTESCSSPGAPRPSDHVPSGFVVTTATCHVCGENPMVATLTTPAPQAPSAAPGNSAPAPAPASPTGSGSSPAAPPSAGSPLPGAKAPAAPASPAGAPASPAGAPASPAGAPASPGSDSPGSGSPGSGSPGSGSPGSSSPGSGSSGSGSPGSGSPGGAAPAAGPAAKAPIQPGAAASYQPAGAAPASPGSTGVSGASNSSYLPFTGGASTVSLTTTFTTVMMAAMGVLAFAL
ncbi:MAG: hypothetical protein Q9225_006976 [Loekoesia sp. 1 TL-2023]